MQVLHRRADAVARGPRQTVIDVSLHFLDTALCPSELPELKRIDKEQLRPTQTDALPSACAYTNRILARCLQPA